MILSSRPSLIVPRLFSTLGSVATIIGTLMLIIACIFLVVEIGAVTGTVREWAYDVENQDDTTMLLARRL